MAPTPHKLILVFLCSFFFCLVGKAQVSVQEIIDTELAFAKVAMEQETIAAFLAYMSENSLLEKQGKLVKGRSIYLNLPPDTIGKLIWYPTVATISAAGDLDCTSGPYTYQIKGKPVAHGDFATVWEKQVNNRWTFVIDLGNSHDPFDLHNAGVKVEKISLETENKNTVLKTDLIQIDKDLNTQLQQGSPKAYLRVLHPSARILRLGKPPVISGKEKEALFSQKTYLQFVPEGVKLALANDLGVVYGTCTISSPPIKI